MTLLITKGQNFGLVQIQSICRRQIKDDKMMKLLLDRAFENIVGKGENAG